MPIYEYECRKCRETIEAIQKMTDPELKKHEGCGGKLTKLLSVPSFHVKGTDDALRVKGHFSHDQQAENEIKSREKKKKAPKIIGSPAGKRSSR